MPTVRGSSRRRHVVYARSESTFYDTPTEDWISNLCGKVTIPPSGCWIYGDDADEYAQISVHGEFMRGHRAVYELIVGPIPQDWIVHHRCETKACINPDHLEAMTAGDHSALHAQLRRQP